MYELEKRFHQFPITMILIGICVVVYIISFILYGQEMNVYEALEFGGYNPLYVDFYHEYYRLLTSNFIHFGIFHLLMNCYSLYNLGSFIETFMNKVNYIIVLFVSGLATTGIPYILYLFNGFGSNSVSGGISGVIFGLIGAIIALAMVYHNIFDDVLRQLAPSIIIMLLLSLTISSISMSGHVCGMIGGFVATYILLNTMNDHRQYYN
ncbi:MAG: rhomboid family intramembrane serine protease [Erysipelotrichaceae bacterium]|nr:rhomboid family intramembrane serine protease [Erysipelotrichaceae bacterium]